MRTHTNTHTLQLYTYFAEGSFHPNDHSNAYIIVSTLFFSFLVIITDILLLISCEAIYLYIAQASSSFKSLDMHTFTYITLNFITEALCLVTIAAFNKCYIVNIQR